MIISLLLMFVHYAEHQCEIVGVRKKAVERIRNQGRGFVVQTFSSLSDRCHAVLKIVQKQTLKQHISELEDLGGRFMTASRYHFAGNITRKPITTVELGNIMTE